MSDVSDVAPLPSTPSHHGDNDMDIGMSPGGGMKTSFIFVDAVYL